jgi:hypothetical protein
MENKEYYIEKYKNIKDKLDLYLNDIEEIVINSKDEYLLEGNIFYYHVSLLKCDNNLPKQINLFWIGSLINKRILEIGFNAGHSALLFILGHIFINLSWLFLDHECFLTLIFKKNNKIMYLLISFEMKHNS